MAIMAVIALIIQFLPQILAGAGVITPAIASLIEGLGAAIPGLIQSLVSGEPVDDKVLDLLRAFQAEIAALQQSGTLDATALAQANTLTAAIAEALSNYQAAGATCDPTTLTPLPTNL